MKHLILGNGAAGITAAGKLRELGSLDEITIVSSENTPVYSKCMLPDYIGGSFSREKLFIRDMNFYNKNSIDLVLEEKVQGIDIKNKCINLGNGLVKEFDRLLIAVGGISFVPGIEGLDEIEYFLVNSIGDADRLRQSAFKGGNAVIIGAGLTGVELGFALKKLGMKVSIVEREGCILPQLLDEHSSDVMLGILKQEGIDVIKAKTVSRVLEGRGKAVELSDGQVIGFDLLVIASGTRPNIGIIKESGIGCNRGILIDRKMRTSVADIYGAGDVAENTDKVSGGYVSSYIWPNAMAQGRCAAYNMSGQEQEISYSDRMQNMVQMRDMPFMSMGLISPGSREYEVLVSYDDKDGFYKKLVIKDNVIKGMIFIGDTSNANSILSYIRKGTDITSSRQTILDSVFHNKYSCLDE